MAEIKKGTYEYNKMYAEKYLTRFRSVTFRLTPEEYEKFKSLVDESGKGVNQFIKDRIFGEE